MPPNTLKDDSFTDEKVSQPVKLSPWKYVIAWDVVIYMVYVHISAVYGLYLCVTAAMWKTVVFTFLMHNLTLMGVTAGAHRLWSHKSYKAKLPLQIFLMICQSATNSHTLITWIRDHIIHHKFTDTDADPHNSKRGFFFSHMGWVMVRKHPEASAKGHLVDLTEYYADPVLRFQQKYAILVIITSTFIVPTYTPLLWNEALSISYHINLLRVVTVLNAAFTVNSVAHKWGNRPYDKRIQPADNKIVSFYVFGEGYHNYHHVFPQDYRTPEVGGVCFNGAARFIEFCAWIGQAYDLKSTADDVVRARMERTGEKS